MKYYDLPQLQYTTFLSAYPIRPNIKYGILSWHNITVYRYSISLKSVQTDILSSKEIDDLD